MGSAGPFAGKPRSNKVTKPGCPVSRQCRNNLRNGTPSFITGDLMTM
jgi:hypothetical protein